MTTPAKQTAARNAAQAIAVGILKDACDALLGSDAVAGPGKAQAGKVSRWGQEVIDTLPRITSVAGLRHLEAVCDVTETAFRATWRTVPADSALSACVRIFALHYVLGELRRRHKLKTRPWRYLDQTATTLVAMILSDMPEEESPMWQAAGPTHDRIMQIMETTK